VPMRLGQHEDRRKEPFGRPPEGVGERRELPPTPEIDLAAQAVRAAVGLIALGVETAIAVLRRVSGLPEHVGEEGAPPAGALLTGAALGFALEATRTAGSVLGLVRRVALPPVTFAAGTFLDRPRRVTEDVLAGWNRGWRDERPEVMAVANEVVAEATVRAVAAVLDQLDLTALVLERVDLERVIAEVDLDEVAGRIDLDAIVRRVDVEGVVRRVDLDAVAARIDLDAIVDRVDLIGLARYVIDEIDLPEVIRESTGSMASETVRSVRMQGIEADQAVSKLVDRALLRRRARRTETPTTATTPTHEDPSP